MIALAYVLLPIALLAGDGSGWALLGLLSLPLAAAPVAGRPRAHRRPGPERRPRRNRGAARRLRAAGLRRPADLSLVPVSMRIRSLETIPVGLPFRRPYVTATGRARAARDGDRPARAPTDGAIGYGDAVPMSLRGGPGLDAVRADLADICAPALAGLDLGRRPDRGRSPAALDALPRGRRRRAGPQRASTSRCSI